MVVVTSSTPFVVLAQFLEVERLETCRGRLAVSSGRVE